MPPTMSPHLGETSLLSVLTAQTLWLPLMLILLGVLAGSIITTLLMRRRLLRQRRRLLATEQRLNFVLDSIDAYVYIKDKNYQYIYANRKMCEQLDIKLETLVGKYDWEIFQNAETYAEIHHNDEQAFELGERVTADEAIREEDGSVIRTLFSIKTPLRDPLTQEYVLCGISTDLTSLRAAQSENYKLAFYDPLTDLPNRRLLRQRLDTLLSSANLYETPYALYALDLDKFQHINDARGHAIGDMLLLRVAARLRGLNQHRNMVARLGGDEFVVLYALETDTSLSLATQASELGEQLRRQIEAPYHIADYTYVTSTSIGWTLLSPAQQVADDALREADTALSHAKQEGRNQVCAYDDGMRLLLEERLSLKHDLLHAIQHGKLNLYMQSQFNADRAICGAEALLRWEHPEHGYIPPSIFIPLAEDTDLISPLGDWLLLTVCELLNQTRQHRFTISINISPAQFNHADFAQRVHRILESNTDQTHRLVMEVTEGTLMSDLPTAIQVMADLAELGIRFSIDDFGTGYSNLSAIKRLPLYELKLDRSLIEDIPENSNTCAIAQAVMAMATQLQLQVVAEGIETQAQLDFLNTHGQPVLQGYYLSQPVASAQWLASLETSRTAF